MNYSSTLFIILFLQDIPFLFARIFFIVKLEITDSSLIFFMSKISYRISFHTVLEKVESTLLRHIRHEMIFGTPCFWIAPMQEYES